MKKGSVNDGTDRATVNTSATLGAVSVDRILVASGRNGTHRTGIDTGTTSNTIFGNLQSHDALLVAG